MSSLWLLKTIMTYVLFPGERPYKCHVPDCGRAFIQLSNLQQHLRNHESQLERLKNRPFHCNICGKGFATESSLRTHNGKVCAQFIPWWTRNEVSHFSSETTFAGLGTSKKIVVQNIEIVQDVWNNLSTKFNLPINVQIKKINTRRSLLHEIAREG